MPTVSLQCLCITFALICGKGHCHNPFWWTGTTYFYKSWQYMHTFIKKTTFHKKTLSFPFVYSLLPLSSELIAYRPFQTISLQHHKCTVNSQWLKSSLNLPCVLWGYFIANISLTGEHAFLPAASPDIAVSIAVRNMTEEVSLAPTGQYL